MIPVKIQCGCGQKYAFDVEPVDGQMAAAIACPICGLDGTTIANQIISEAMSSMAQPPPLTTLSTATVAGPAARTDFKSLPAARSVKRSAAKASGEFSLGLGIVGAVIGAAIGIGVMYGFFEVIGFRFPLLGVGIGVLTGLGAKMLGRGIDSTLGFISGTIALVSVVGALFLMYGTFPLLSIISALVSASVAYRISSG